jgi:predicted transcriptional regulator
MLVSVVSYTLGRRFGVYSEQVKSPEDSPAHAGDSVRDWLEARQVGALVQTGWPYTVSAATSLSKIVAMIPAGTFPVLVVADEQQVRGFISTAELTQALNLADTPSVIIAADIMNTTVSVLRRDDDLYAALERFGQAGVAVLPVVERDGKTLAGVLKRADMLKSLREHVAARSAAALREHAVFSTLAKEVELDDLLAVLSPRREDHVLRMRVPEQVLGLSLREADFRSRYGAYVIAIETASGELLAPPDPQRPLGKDDMLVVMHNPASPAPPRATDNSSEACGTT